MVRKSWIVVIPLRSDSAHLLVGSPAEALRVRVHHPHVEGQLLEQPFRHHVMGMVVRVHEPGDDQLAGCLKNLDPIVGHDVRGNALNDLAADQNIGGRRLMDVAVMVVDPTTTNEVARNPSLFRHA
jgi:hypothetical protein